MVHGWECTSAELCTVCVKGCRGALCVCVCMALHVEMHGCAHTGTLWGCMLAKVSMRTHWGCMTAKLCVHAHLHGAGCASTRACGSECVCSVCSPAHVRRCSTPASVCRHCAHLHCSVCVLCISVCMACMLTGSRRGHCPVCVCAPHTRGEGVLRVWGTQWGTRAWGCSCAAWECRYYSEPQSGQVFPQSWDVCAPLPREASPGLLTPVLGSSWLTTELLFASFEATARMLMGDSQ